MPEKYRSSQSLVLENTGSSFLRISLEADFKIEPPKYFCPSSQSPQRFVPSLARVKRPTGEGYVVI